ncbi:killer toxin sensitivity protein [Ophiostoma piceae UAMH 11346]|uniref:Elongator complex protein 5 n=1 Tax=Ophiostoma piceae (strain UAMH 11346) TaxID=1262450 RepID=S3CNX2_OPHP1|nr:killer toxin sensitivity protein [Ophiostoma piceae UAMH 11346]
MATKSHSKSSYSVLLLQKLLNLRDGVSPLTLVLDTPREPGTPLLEEMMLRAKTGAGGAARTKVVYVCSNLAPRRQSPHVDVYIERRDEPSLEAFQARILKEVPPPPAPTSSSSSPSSSSGGTRCLIIIDSLGPIAQSDPLFVAAFVSSLVSPTTSVVGLYRTDNYASSIQLPLSPELQGKPHPYKVLTHLATAVLRVNPLDEEVARKRARDRAEELPQFGWAEGEGFPFAYNNWRYSKTDLMATAATPGTGAFASDIDRRGILVDMELRRRSGRAVVERYVMVLGGAGGAGAKKEPSSSAGTRGKMPWQKGATPCTDITVMSDHPLFAVPDLSEGFKRPGDGNGNDDDSDEDLPTSTFNLGLTDKQRRDREGIVLPYFDAQTDIGAGEGGRILYDLGREDDFDDEEDESWEG